MSDFETKDLHRRLANIINIGVISEADYDAAQVRVRIGELNSAWIPWLAQRAGADIQWWAPEVGEQVVVISPNGDLSQGIVLNGLYQEKFPTGNNRQTLHQQRYADGAIIEYDREKHALKATLPSGGTAELFANGGITITGDVTLNGKVTVTGDASFQNNVDVTGKLDVASIVTSKEDVVAKGVSVVGHTHVGDSGGVTGLPQ